MRPRVLISISIAVVLFYAVFFWLNVSRTGTGVHLEGVSLEFHFEAQPTKGYLEALEKGSLPPASEIPTLLVYGPTELHLTNAHIRVLGAGDWQALDLATNEEASGSLGKTEEFHLWPTDPENSGLYIPLSRKSPLGGTPLGLVFDFAPNIQADFYVLPLELPNSAEGYEDIQSWIEFAQGFPTPAKTRAVESQTVVLRVINREAARQEQLEVYDVTIWPPDWPPFEVSSQRYAVIAGEKRLKGDHRITIKGHLEQWNEFQWRTYASARGVGVALQAKPLYIAVEVQRSDNVTSSALLKVSASLLRVTSFDGFVIVGAKRVDIPKADLNIKGDLQISGDTNIAQKGSKIAVKGEAHSLKIGGEEQIPTRWESYLPSRLQDYLFWLATAGPIGGLVTWFIVTRLRKKEDSSERAPKRKTHRRS